MSVTLRSFIIGVILIIVAFFAYRLTEPNKQLSKEDLPESQPSFIAYNFHGKSYDKDGNLNIDLNSDKVEYFEKADTAKLENIKGKLFYIQNSETSQVYNLNADKATIKFNNMANISGNILIIPESNNTDIKKKEAANLFYDFNQNTIKSNDKVAITGTNWTNIGSNLLIDLNNKTAILHGEVHATYNN